MRAAILAATLALTAPAATTIDRHDAKIAAFKTLLRVTELAPDAGDATHAAITVNDCARAAHGYRCTGTLAPVAFSGIPDSTCRYTIRVTARHARITGTSC
jgi:hypothetical protein